MLKLWGLNKSSFFWKYIMELTRNKEQEQVMFIIYQSLFMSRLGSEVNIINLIEEQMDCPIEEVSIFIKETVVKILLHSKEIHEIIVSHLKNWSYERMNLVLIAILYLAIGEYNYIKEISKNAMIDVAIKLTKKYCSEKDYKFVNALLDRVLD